MSVWQRAADLLEAEPTESDLNRDLRPLLQRLGWRDGRLRASDFALEHWPGFSRTEASRWAAEQLRRFGVTEPTPGSATSFTWPTRRQGGGGTQVMPSQPEPQAISEGDPGHVSVTAGPR